MTNSANTTKVITGKVRLSYAHLLTPNAIEEGQDPKYSVSLLIPKTDKKTLAAIKKAQQVAAENGKVSKFGGKLPKNLKTTLRDGDEEKDVDGDESEYKGMMFMNVSSKTKPGIVDKQRDPIDDPEEIYSGMYARASINFYAYNTAGNKGISAGLNNIQKVADGDFMGGRSRAEDDFDDWEDDEDDTDTSEFE